MVAAKVTNDANDILSRWELAFQRSTLLDGLTTLRAASAAAAKPDEFELLVETSLLEQVCQSRRAIAAKWRRHIRGLHESDARHPPPPRDVRALVAEVSQVGGPHQGAWRVGGG